MNSITKKNRSCLKRFLRAILLIVCFIPFFLGCKENTGVIISGLQEEFKNPSEDYRSAPLWVWNTKVTKADIDRMLAEFKEAGFGGVFVHPRPGLITEYLSDDWFDLYKYSCEVAKGLGLNVWIYDENSYPSGFAGGHVPDQMPASYNQGQGLKVEKANKLPSDLSKYYICLKKEGNKFVDITNNTANHKEEGEYYLYEKTYYGKSDWYAGFSYVDLLIPGVTEKFIEVTMDGYHKHLGDKLGNDIKGIFTDEPNIVGSGGMRWTPDLFDVFKKQWGYDLQNCLPMLEEEIGNYKEVRHNYMETLLQLFVDRWAKPCYEYTEKYGLDWTGHYWEHGWPDMSQGPDNMAMYAWHQVPAIDMLFNQFNDVSPMAQFGNVRSVKELRSVANQMGYKRTLSETYGGGGWDVTFEDLKRLGDWEYVLGVNFMNQHLSHMTLAGARKYDYPPVFTSVSPWWNDYKSLNDYFARLSLVLSEGEQYNDILVIEPTTTIWMYYNYYKREPKIMDIGNSFQAFVTQIEKQQVEYDLGSENIIKDQGASKNGLFVVGQREYNTVVIPPMTESLNSATFNILKDFVNKGGKLICFSKPNLIDGKENEELKALMAENKSNIIHHSGLTPQVIAEDLSNNLIQFTNINSNDLYHQRRSYGDGELLFVVNSSLEKEAKATVSVKGNFLYEMSPMDGNNYEYPFVKDGNNVKFEINLPPAGSILLFSSKSKVSDLLPMNSYIKSDNILKATNDVSINRVRDNVLTIDFCDLIIDGSKTNTMHIASASDKLFKHFGLPNGNPWNSSVQFKQNIVEKDNFKNGDIKVQYHFNITEDFDMSKFKLVAEQPNIWKARINNKDVVAISGENWLDARFGVYNIGNYLKKGINTVELYTQPMSIYAEIEPVYIFGDFALESANTGWNMKAPVKELHFGSWKEQGQPFYSWEMSYSKNYNITDLSKKHAVQLNDWNGTLTEVWVNDSKAGIIAYAPFLLDITSKLKEGDNKIDVRVIGSLKNLLGPHHKDDAGIAGPWHWKNITTPLAGKDYKMIDYGLMKDFDLVSN